MTFFSKKSHHSYCEWKGKASYLDFNLNEEKISIVGWFYENPNPEYSELKDHIAFYASKFDECYIDDMKVKAQRGDFFGGWITPNIVGPLKGDAGTLSW